MGISSTDFNLSSLHSGLGDEIYHGKVRDVYYLNDEYLALVATDRISAFDHILPKEIPGKGRVLNGIAVHCLNAVGDTVPHWLVNSPHPNVSIGYRCEPIKIEMVVRGYLAGHAWRKYKAGRREVSGVKMPDGLRESDAFPEPILTPATKAEEGHDEDISREDILASQIVPEHIYLEMERYSRVLFRMGTEMAAKRGLILVDTKYEFGLFRGKLMLMDEIHTPDSSRYYYAQGYEDRQQSGTKQEQLSKEFVREWLIEHGFQGLEGQKMPTMPDDFVQLVSARYAELYSILCGKKLSNRRSEHSEIQESIIQWANKNIAK